VDGDASGSGPTSLIKKASVKCCFGMQCRSTKGHARWLLLCAADTCPACRPSAVGAAERMVCSLCYIQQPRESLGALVSTPVLHRNMAIHDKSTGSPAGKRGTEPPPKGGKAYLSTRGKGTGPSRGNGRGGQQQPGPGPKDDKHKARQPARQPNPFVSASFSGWDRFAVFEEADRPLAVDAEILPLAGGMLHKRDLTEACVWLSIASHLNRSSQAMLLRSLGKEKWGVVGDEALPSVLSMWARRAYASWRLWEAVPFKGADTITLTEVCSGAPAGGRTRVQWNFLRTQSDQGYHLLPLDRVKDIFVLSSELYPNGEATDECLGSSVSNPAVAESSEPSCPETSPPRLLTWAEKGKAVCVPPPAPCVSDTSPPPCPSKLAGGVGVGAQVPVRLGIPSATQRRSEFIHTELLDEEEYLLLGDSDEQTRWMSETAFSEEREEIAYPLGACGPIDVPRLRYVGEWAPMSHCYHRGTLHKVDWTSGWMVSLNPGVAMPSPLLRGSVHLAAASVKQAAWYLDSVLYYPLPSGSGLTPMGRRDFTDGVEQVSTFRHGDTLQIAGESWSASWSVNGEELLCLTRVEKPALPSLSHFVRTHTVRLRQWCGLSPPTTVVRAPQPEPLDDEVKLRIDWTAVQQSAPDELQAMLQQARNVAASRRWGETAPNPFSSSNYVAGLGPLVKSRPFGYAGGRPFRWGYCYSCGKLLPSARMPGRLCGCPPTPAARTLARGEHVTCVGGVVYPGVVSTESQHPPLKEGKETLATDQCFRAAP
jgi:hypothetical protein